MATKHTDTCLIKAADDEPIFVLRAQDALAGQTVRFWAIRLREENGGIASPKVVEAFALAAQMDAWPTRKIPD